MEEIWQDHLEVVLNRQDLQQLVEDEAGENICFAARTINNFLISASKLYRSKLNNTLQIE